MNFHGQAGMRLRQRGFQFGLGGAGIAGARSWRAGRQLTG